MKALKFRQHLTKDILKGRKTVTWRLFDEKNLQVGDRVIFQNWETGEDFAKAEIVGVREKKLSEITETDFEGHEKYESKEEMLRHYREYYGDRVTWDTPVKIIRFKLV